VSIVYPKIPIPLNTGVEARVKLRESNKVPHARRSRYVPFEPVERNLLHNSDL